MNSIANKVTKKVLFVLSICLLIPLVLSFWIYLDYSHFNKQILESVNIKFPGCSMKTDTMWKIQSDFSLIQGINYLYNCDSKDFTDGRYAIEVSKNSKFISYNLTKFNHSPVVLYANRNFTIDKLPVNLTVTIYDYSDSESNFYYITFKNEFQIGNLHYCLNDYYNYNRELNNNDFLNNEVPKILKLSEKRILQLLNETNS